MAIGIRIIEDKNMVDAIEDWSRVRSPGRAARRRRRGHRQNIAVRLVPKPYAYVADDGRAVMHPDIAAQLRASIEA